MKLLGKIISFIGDIISGRRVIKLVTSSVVIIYGIRGVERKQYFYVGKTLISNYEHRFRTHIQESKNNTHKNKKLMEVIQKHDYIITMDILEVCNEYDAPRKELEWINFYKNKKHPLVNIKNPMNPYQDLQQK